MVKVSERVAMGRREDRRDGVESEAREGEGGREIWSIGGLRR